MVPALILIFVFQYLGLNSYEQFMATVLRGVSNSNTIIGGRSDQLNLITVMTDLTEKDLAKVPFLTVVENGCGSPCIDFRQVSSELASLAEDTDLVVLEGMGRALHTNFNAKFKCDVLKLAMVKNQRLAEQIINGSIYDCVCRFEPKEGLES